MYKSMWDHFIFTPFVITLNLFRIILYVYLLFCFLLQIENFVFAFRIRRLMSKINSEREVEVEIEREGGREGEREEERNSKATQHLK